jgi:hypothetical protein
VAIEGRRLAREGRRRRCRSIHFKLELKRKTNPMNAMPKNAGLRFVKERRKPITYAQLITCFDCFDAMTAAGIAENLSLKVFDHVVNVYASNFHAGKQVLESKAARKMLKNGGTKRDLILEHGTPRRALTLLLMKERRAGTLTEARIKKIMETRWAVAHITRAEDQRLRDLGLNSKAMATPEARWAAAGIEF